MVILRPLPLPLLLVFAALASVSAAPAGAEGPPIRPDTRQVMFVGNNWDGTADIIDARTFQRLARINTIPDKDERLAEINSDPERLGFFLAIRQAVGEGHDQFTDDMFTSHDGRFVYVSRPSFADVVGIDLRTGAIVWRFPMEGQRSDHMGISPDGRRLLVSDSTANKVHQLDTLTGAKTGEFPSGDSPHESNYSKDGSLIFHASIGRVYTPTDAAPLGLARDTSKGARYLQIVDAKSLQVLKRWDIGQKLDEAGYPDLEAAVRPMAIAPDERFVYLQVSFHHGFIEFDLKEERVTRVVNLPISEEAQNTPREEYLLDSAHHGLAINAQGTKLCVAGTMSDYAAIASPRETFAPKLFDIGAKPYWSTNGPGGLCWVSASGDDRVVVLDYESEREVARIPVGDHPQRVRVGAIQRSYVGGLPLPPGGRDTVAPRVRITGKPRRCRSRDFSVGVRVSDQSPLRFARATLGRRRLRATRRTRFRVNVPVAGLRPRTHRLRITAGDAFGNRTKRVVRFKRC